MFCAQRLVTNKMYSSGLMDRLETHKKKKKTFEKSQKEEILQEEFTSAQCTVNSASEVLPLDQNTIVK